MEKIIVLLVCVLLGSLVIMLWVIICLCLSLKFIDRCVLLSVIGVNVGVIVWCFLVLKFSLVLWNSCLVSVCCI